MAALYNMHDSLSIYSRRSLSSIIINVNATAVFLQHPRTDKRNIFSRENLFVLFLSGLHWGRWELWCQLVAICNTGVFLCCPSIMDTEVACIQCLKHESARRRVGCVEGAARPFAHVTPYQCQEESKNPLVFLIPCVQGICLHSVPQQEQAATITIQKKSPTNLPSTMCNNNKTYNICIPPHQAKIVSTLVNRHKQLYWQPRME